ncbi:MAG: hypothetical protein Q7T71_03880, partial [Herbiconiux sp.]|nr:hypothetical protein [Herbiconiux sp.]
MGEVLHLSALLPATVGVCCTLGAGRGGVSHHRGRAARLVAAVSALLMLLAMLDVSTRMLGLTPPAWSAVLLLAALAAAPVALRARPRAATPPGPTAAE